MAVFLFVQKKCRVTESALNFLLGIFWWPLLILRDALWNDFPGRF